jgi:transcriptional regulator with XRE-family HTH domain
MQPNEFKFIREQYGLSHATLAILLRVSGGRQVQRYENGERVATPQIAMLMRLLNRRGPVALMILHSRNTPAVPADKALIAAAPDLLEVAHMVTGAAKANRKLSEAQLRVALDMLAGAALDAIAKAEGKDDD